MTGARPVRRKPPLAPLNVVEGTKQPVQKLSEGECIPEATGKRCGDSLSMITDWLYLGSYSDALDKSLLKKNKISYILNTAKECESADSTNSSDSETDGESWPTYLKLDLVDHADEAIGTVFQKAYQFIDTARKEDKRVLVHCRRGISRSATLVIAYLMKSQNLQLDKAFNHVRCRRSIINPNIGFVLSLETFAAQLGHKPKRQLLGLDDFSPEFGQSEDMMSLNKLSLQAAVEA